nr:chaB3 [Calliteara abietis nucleopolyhedrovirus]
MFCLNVFNLPKPVKLLPHQGQRIFVKFYTRATKMGICAEAAYKIAWSAVKRKYYKANGRWVPYTDDNDFDTTPSNSDDEDEDENGDDDNNNNNVDSDYSSDDISSGDETNVYNKNKAFVTK